MLGRAALLIGRCALLGRAVLVVAGAGLYALALPPFGWASLAWLTLVPLLLIARGGGIRRAAGYGALYGFAASWAVTWWLVQAIERYFAAGIFFAALAMSAVYAIAVAATFGLFAAGAASLHRAPARWIATLGVPALWTGIDLLRGRLLGQPWALLGYTQYGHPALIQIAAVTGVYGVSFLVALGNGAIADAIAHLRAGERRRVPLAAAVPLGVIALAWTVGAAVIPAGHGEPATRPVAVVQTNHPPAFRWTRSYAEEQLLLHVRATAALAAERPALIVWPENALTLYLETEPLVAAELSRLARQIGADLLLGAPRYAAGRTYNSAHLLTASGRDGGFYDKQRLVLFAETSPLAPPAPAGPSESPRAFSAGAQPGVLRGFVPFGVSICHEILYPDIVSRAVLGGAEMLVNVANDGWLDGGYGVASEQHFAMAAFRAVETRRYLVRAAMTGTSGVVDPYGRVLATQGPATAGVVRARVAGRRTLTPYVRWGDAFAFGCLGLALALLGVQWAPRGQRAGMLTPVGVER